MFSVFLTMGLDQTWVIYSQSLQIRYTWGISHIKNKVLLLGITFVACLLFQSDSIHF